MTHKFIYICPDEEATVYLAQKLSLISASGDVWALFGTLGMGKSVFSRAFIQKSCQVEEVPSPTFTLLQVYEASQFEIYHYDLYRLKDPEEIWELNMEEAMYSAVCLIEWPEKMGAYLPRDVFRLEITPTKNNGRRIEISVTSDDKAARLSKCERQPDEKI